MTETLALPKGYRFCFPGAPAPRIVDAPVPSNVRLSLRHPIGVLMQACVQAGDSVRTGQVVAESEDYPAVKLVSPVTGNVTEAIVLVNNATETGWFQGMLPLASAVCFPRGRVRFLDPEGNPGAPLQGQAVLYFGERRDVFAEEFGQFGAVLYGR